MGTIYYLVNNYEDLRLGLPHYLAMLRAIDALGRRGLRVVLVMPRQSVTLDELRAVYGLEGRFEIHWTPALRGPFRRQMLSSLLGCWYVLRRRRPGDVAYTRYLPGGLLGLLGCPVVVEMHQWFWQSRVQQLGYRAIIKTLLRLDRRRRIALVTITRAMRALMPDRMFLRRPWMVAGSGVSPGLRTCRRARGDGPAVFFYAGIFEAQKGTAFMYRLANAAPEHCFLFVGCPEEQRAEVEAGLRHGNVELLGRVPPARLPGLLARADYGLLLNDPDSGWLNRVTSPLKLFEYMMAGKIVVATDMPTVREVVEDGVQALLVDPGDTAGILARVAELEADPARREAMLRAAEECALEHTWDRRAERLAGLLERISKEG